MGKLTLGLRVVSEDFRPATFRGTFIRAVVFFADALFFGLIAYYYMSRSALRQRYGDELGGTVVVRVKAAPVARRGAVPVTLGLLLGISAAITILVFELVVRMERLR